MAGEEPPAGTSAEEDLLGGYKKTHLIGSGSSARVEVYLLHVDA